MEEVHVSPLEFLTYIGSQGVQIYSPNERPCIPDMEYLEKMRECRNLRAFVRTMENDRAALWERATGSPAEHKRAEYYCNKIAEATQRADALEMEAERSLTGLLESDPARALEDTFDPILKHLKDWFLDADDFISEDPEPSMKEKGDNSPSAHGLRKPDYRTDQWRDARPIMEALYTDKKAITLPEIKRDPRFKACFKTGMPGDRQIRRKLKEAGIKLVSGTRIKTPR
jgi:hypothetical protein